MNLSAAQKAYDAENENRTRQTIELADGQNHKRGHDIEAGRGAGLILTDTVTGTRYRLTVASGSVALTSL